MGGGPTAQQNTALSNQAALGDTANTQMAQGIAKTNAAQAQATPFYQSRMNNGLPFMKSLTDYNSGQNAQAYAPARANLMRATSRYGTNMPSGYRDSMLGNLEGARARSFDSSMTGNLMANEQAKQAGAAGVMNTAMASNPMGWAGLQSNTDQGIIGADNMRKPNVWGTLGGLAMQGMQTGGQIAAKSG